MRTRGGCNVQSSNTKYIIYLFLLKKLFSLLKITLKSLSHNNFRKFIFYEKIVIAFQRQYKKYKYTRVLIIET